MFQFPIRRPWVRWLKPSARAAASTDLAAAHGHLMANTAQPQPPCAALMRPCCCSDRLIVAKGTYPTEYTVQPCFT